MILQKDYKMLINALFCLSLQLGLNKIPQEAFLEASFKGRIDMLKIAFEKSVIALQDNLVSTDYIVDKKVLEFRKTIITISRAIKATVDKKKDITNNDGVLFRCFLHEDKTPSMSWSAAQHGFYCFGCGEDNKIYDVFNLYGIFYNKTFKEAFKSTVEWFVEEGHKIKNPFSEAGSKTQNKHSDFIPYTREMNKVRHYSFLYPIENDEICLNKLLEERGISFSTAKRHSVMTWYPEVDGVGTKVKMGYGYWVFINDDGSYTRRLAVENKELTKHHTFKPMKWWNPSKQEMGIFNPRVIKHCQQFGQVCFITESAIDALSCEELGFHSVGLNSINNVKKFLIEYVNQEAANVMFICLVDNDTEGKKRVKTFEKQGIFVPDYLKQDYVGDCFLSCYKDINECLVADRIKTSAELKILKKQAIEFYGGK